MIERGLYYATTDFAQMIKAVGGIWNDTKHRPIVCLIKSSENASLYWAIPMGKLNHRDQIQQKRLNFYLNLPEKDIRSCYYHIGRTSSRSILERKLFRILSIENSEKNHFRQHITDVKNHLLKELETAI